MEPYDEENRTLDAVLVIAGLLMLVVLASVMLGCNDPKSKDVKDGHTPVITTSPATPLECPTGGLEVRVDLGSPNIICNGIGGARGPIGDPGPQGTPGQDLTPITMIQLCPGTTVYPNVFLEYGICLQNQIYGVYSADGGFLALLPPGNYLSNAIGSSCNLTIGPDCQVTN